MAPVFCLCKVWLPNSRFGIRLFQLDPVVFKLKHGGGFYKNNNCGLDAPVRYQGTKADTHNPGIRSKHRTKKKTFVDIIREKEDSLLEGKAKVKRLNQHSFDQTMSFFQGASASIPNDASCPETPPSAHLEEVTFEKFNNVLRDNCEKVLPSVLDVNDIIKWNKGVMHTYDENFVISDCDKTDFKCLPDSQWDIDTVRKLCENESETFSQSTSIDLARLSSPLTGFSHVREMDFGADVKSIGVEKKTGVLKKTKKKIVSTKKKSASNVSADAAKDKKKTATKQKSIKMTRSELVKNLSKIENNPYGISSEHLDEAVLEGLSDALDKKKMSSKGKQREGGSAKIFKKQLQQEKQFKEIVTLKHQCREILFNQALEAYLSVCVNNGLLNRALHTLLYYRQMSIHGSGKKILSVEPYNIILQGLAEKGNYGKMEELRNLLEQDKIEMNAQTFAPFLNYLGRQPISVTNTNNIQTILDSMKNTNVTIDSLFSDVTYANNGYDNILRALHRINPNFRPEKKQKTYEYSCNLLNSLNDSLYTSKVRPPLSGLATEQELNMWFEEQFSRELNGEITIASIERKEETPEILMFREKLARWEARWREALHTNFTLKVDAMKKSFTSNQRSKEMSLYPYLVCLSPKEFVNIMMQEIYHFASGSEAYSLSRYNLYRGMGEKVYQRFLINHKKETGALNKLKIIYKKLGLWMLEDHHGDGVPYLPRVQWKHLTQEEHSSDLHQTLTEWPNSVLLGIGQFLYSLLLRHVMVWKPLHTEKHVYPAFYEIDRSYDYKSVEEIKPAPILLELYRRSARPTLIFPSYVAPMVSPPIPWTSPNSGGYLINSSNIVRLPYNAQQQKHRMKGNGEEQMFPVMDSLNQLGSIPWKVNKPLLDLIIEVFNNNGWEEMGIPPPISECPVPPKIKSYMSSSEKKQILRQRLEYNKKKSEMFSLWCDALYKLSFANHFRDRIIWFPHNMDFRGRVYPLPPHINHMSSDVFRSLLYFARGEKLGSRGLWWLKMHLINLTGFVKRESLEDRIKYCDSVLDDIMDSADNPLTGRKWWTESDEPWQTLAACKELTAALRSDNPEEYVCHLPIHQDGSCNGLQHYAALGRDVAGAVSVNLAPSIVPQDVYSAVAELVEKERLKDAAEGNELAQMLDGYVKRKVIKQTVMTTVYGVTRFGARLQIERQLKDLDFPPAKTWAASYYLVKKTFNSLEQMFTSAKEIQDWFTDLARMVSKTCRQNVEWVTPLGFPVVQHYTVPLSEKCPRIKMGMTLNIDYIMQPNTMKQKNAFPPNFIHSLDSTHMMLTSLYSQKTGFTFVSVHDCFWTHACSVDAMNRVCREQFVALHSEPILENLSLALRKRFSFEYKDFAHDGSAKDTAKMKVNTLLNKIPRKGNFDINEVLKSTYFFS
ncbi:LOW QUALITY PROTEIN: DNA-directed RNA polymerase, mitochondrial [Palaemon carinicauda]|uniref:LOW QUALITY PROTEIN: DNA-directed RNA polymerase, mitochondrial n=1 Tax=Palaemon carinicauda TaxID=392227 RepID=UPI0035B5881E